MLRYRKQNKQPDKAHTGNSIAIRGTGRTTMISTPAIRDSTTTDTLSKRFWENMHNVPVIEHTDAQNNGRFIDFSIP